MKHGVVEVVAYQETLLVMAVFGVVILAMLWVGFRRWLRHQHEIGRLIAEQTAERAAQYGANMEAVENRLKAIEQMVANSRQPTAQIDSLGTQPLPDPIKTRGQV